MRSQERKMLERTLAEGVEIPEQSVRILAMLPSRVSAVETQIVQLRSEMQAEFSAIREEFRHDIRTGLEALRLEIRAGDEETRRYMRVLHEEVIARIATIQEGDRPGNG